MNEDPESFTITADKQKELEKLWTGHPDLDGNRLSTSKAADIFWNAGYILGSEYTKRLEEALHEEHGEAVTLGETRPIFIQTMIKKLNQDFFKNLFRMLDKDKQGIIPAEHLKKILSQLPDSDEAEIDAMIDAIDDDGNGEISFDEFYSLMCDE